MSLALTAAPLWAQTATAEKPVTNIAPLPAATTATPQKMATVTPFISGLKEPQGLTFDAPGNLLVCDYGSGEILKFSPDGKRSGVLATGLKGPAQIVSALWPSRLNSSPAVPPIYVTERKANRVISIDSAGKITPLGTEIPEPLGLVFGPSGLMMVSHTTSKIYRWKNSIPTLNEIPLMKSDRISVPGNIPLIGSLFRSRQTPSVNPNGQWELVYSAPSTDGARYGFRWLASDGGAYFVSDEDGERVLMLTENGRVATFASGISDPSGLAIGPDGMVYVANEGDGGQLIRLNNEGEKTIVAEKLGRPRGILFLDAKTLLVSNRDGNIWKILLP